VEAKERERKTPLFKAREGGSEVTQNADRETVVFLLKKIARAAFGGFFSTPSLLTLLDRKIFGFQP
jgi:hypothetical protein